MVITPYLVLINMTSEVFTQKQNGDRSFFQNIGWRLSVHQQCVLPDFVPVDRWCVCHKLVGLIW